MKFTTYKDLDDWIETHTNTNGNEVLVFLAHLDADMFIGDGNDPHPTVSDLAGMLLYYAHVNNVETFAAEWLTSWYSDIDANDPDDSEENRTDHLIFILQNFFIPSEEAVLEA